MQLALLQFMYVCNFTWRPDLEYSIVTLAIQWQGYYVQPFNKSIFSRTQYDNVPIKCAVLLFTLCNNTVITV